MRKPLRFLAVGLGLGLGLFYCLLRFEWPLPTMAQTAIKKELQKKAIELDFASAHFDLTGNIRLQGVSGRWSGLLNFSAEQLLLRWAFPSQWRLVIDSGRLSTAFLPLPLPENIRFCGALSLRGDEVEFRSLRLSTPKLSLVLEGRMRTASNNGNVSLGLSPLSLMSPAPKEIASLLGAFFSSDQPWAATLRFLGERSFLTLSGKELNFQGARLSAPVVTLLLPSSRFLLSADSLEVASAQMKKVALSYTASEDDLWRGFVQEGSYSNMVARQISFQTHWKVSQLAQPSAMRDLQGQLQLQDAALSFWQGSLEPLQAQLRGTLPAGFLKNFRVKIEAPSHVEAKFANGELFFRARYAAGDFYSLPFRSLIAEGKLSKTGADISGFVLEDGRSSACGSLHYDFATRRARYALLARADPLLLPWFGKKWTQAFEPVGASYPFSALCFESVPRGPFFASGVGLLRDHKYRSLSLDETASAYYAREGKAQVYLKTRRGAEALEAQLHFDPDLTATFKGNATPASLAGAYLNVVPPVLLKFAFSQIPSVEGNMTWNTYNISLKAPGATRFYSLEFSDAQANAHGEKERFTLDSLGFGFAGGRGNLTLQVDALGTGSGNVKIRDAALGEWSLLGPLSELIRTKWLSFAELKLNAADASFDLTAQRVNVPYVNLWGREHAVSGSGSIDTTTQTLDFTARLKILGGSSPSFGILVFPVLAPFSIMTEIRLSGPVENPRWQLQLGL